jgi:PhnB protein
MAEQVSFIPAGFHTVTPYLIVNDGHRALEFYRQAFGAVVNSLDTLPDGKFLNAEFRIGDSNLMMGEHAKELSPVSTKFYGNREGGVEDPFGITWWIATRVENPTPEEMAQRMAEMAQPQCQPQ